jgi:hypothetical protein
MDDDTIAFGEEEEAAKNANRLKYIQWRDTSSDASIFLQDNMLSLVILDIRMLRCFIWPSG